ncbi:MAG TPA: TetR/AcrR family transcriptional regulator [Planktothrix sp.]|jgi:AcrR family transcriptional regulator
MKVKLKTAAQPRDAEATKARILDAAEEEFAMAGLSGARTESIAAKTGVTKAMIYYYYESKERLYEAVLERCFAEHVKEATDPVWLTGDPAVMLERFIRQFLQRAAENPNIPSIVAYEAMQNKGKYYKQVGIISLYRTIASILESGMETRIFRAVDPYHAAVTVVGACVFYFCSRENIKSLWPDKDILSPEMVNAHMDEAIRMIMNGLRVM